MYNIAYHLRVSVTHSRRRIISRFWLIFWNQLIEYCFLSIQHWVWLQRRKCQAIRLSGLTGLIVNGWMWETWPSMFTPSLSKYVSTVSGNTFPHMYPVSFSRYCRHYPSPPAAATPVSSPAPPSFSFSPPPPAHQLFLDLPPLFVFMVPIHRYHRQNHYHHLDHHPHHCHHHNQTFNNIEIVVLLIIIVIVIVIVVVIVIVIVIIFINNI